MSARDVASGPDVKHLSAQVNFPAVTGLRAVAALMVIGYHTANAIQADLTSGFGWLLQRLTSAVPIFFAISGFVLYRPFAAAARDGRRLNLRRFARRRATRMLPAFWVAFAICALVPYVHDRYGGFEPLGPWWRHVTLTQIYTVRLAQHGMTHVWTLSAEIMFYVLLPLLALLAAGLRRPPGGVGRTLACVAAFGAACLAFRVIGYVHLSPVWQLTALANGLWFATGMGIAVLTVAAPQGRVLRSAHGHPLAWWAAAAAVYVVLARLHLPARQGVDWPALDWGVEHAGFALFAGLILAPLTHPETGRARSVRGLLGRNPVRWLGEISYSSYLYHFPVLYLCLPVVDDHPDAKFVWLFAATALATVPVAAVSYYAVERPFIAAGR